MGSALVEGAVKSGALDGGDLRLCDVHEPSAKTLADATGGRVVRLEELADECDAVLLCTKPCDVGGALECIAEGGRACLVISIAAGVPIHALELSAGEKARVIRAMPNTPALVGKGAAAFCCGESTTDGDRDLANSILGSVGLVEEVKESLMDAVTGLSGSGPAYVYLIIEALADAGVRNGLPRAQALKLATQTVAGAAEMVSSTGEHPAVLKDAVTSPGGTTIAGVTALEQGGLRASLIDAVTAATTRSAELAES